MSHWTRNGLVTGRPLGVWRGQSQLAPVCANFCKRPSPLVKKQGDVCSDCEKKAEKKP